MEIQLPLVVVPAVLAREAAPAEAEAERTQRLCLQSFHLWALIDFFILQR